MQGKPGGHIVSWSVILFPLPRSSLAGYSRPPTPSTAERFRQQPAILFLPVEIRRPTDSRLPADLRSRCSLRALSQNERLLRLCESRCLHVFPGLSQPGEFGEKLQVQTVQFSGGRAQPQGLFAKWRKLGAQVSVSALTFKHQAGTVHQHTARAQLIDADQQWIACINHQRIRRAVLADRRDCLIAPFQTKAGHGRL